MFIGTSSLKGDFAWWSTSKVKFMYHVFWASAFDIDLGVGDTSSVVDFSSMYYQNQNFTGGDLSRRDLYNAKVVADMFGYASRFNGNVSTWDISSVQELWGTFAGSAFNGDVNSWDTSSVDSMSFMFSFSPFNGNLSNWDTGAVTTMFSMVRVCCKYLVL